MTSGPDSNWDGDPFRSYNRHGGADSWQDDFLDDPRGGQPDSWPGSSSGSDYSRALFGGPGADLFGSGMSSSSMPSVSSGSVPNPDQGSPLDVPYGHSRPGAGQGRDRSGWDSQAGTRGQGRYDGGPPSGSMPSLSQSMPPVSGSLPSISGSMPAIPGGPVDHGEMQETGSLVRPYARTRGRTRTDYDLAIETLVSTSERGRGQSNPATPEHRSICGLCVEARSVAEVAAHLRLPLGVVRVLIGDMAGLGLVLIHENGMVVGDGPSMEFLERVLSGLRKL
ncbi:MULTISPECIES: DUF742 domain-containing protein [Saccharopolyspora]|uniref:DUF742 domain-containing protein n=1 Tax=Saccharopolyspora gregorii TaxID=33914 RepID=A0ABP6RYJ1_9PSEU|nr:MULTISPECIES: DUF742 domain-containing protein [Saccharopolyspora]MCA1186426.1 DUF742 domain-containing protein [Saccharopolyspora sp. 6T]MCA1193541.1 DUF742 domain-containing protein [Saccharopolyspora sp. 6V]MCA1227531.1 DUF742 domain-containing protein [Saccharopolyspora sp. 6M]MCA1280094.1 DUF742 domain-containing protein [Saccharopolyspora sp. 7B]